jgi:hypothetical protein
MIVPTCIGMPVAIYVMRDMNTMKSALIRFQESEAVTIKCIGVMIRNGLLVVWVRRPFLTIIDLPDLEPCRTTSTG